MKIWGIHGLSALLRLATCVVAFIVLPSVVSPASSSPADSVHYCAVVDDEAWLREDLPHAGKAAAELNVGEPGTVRMFYFLPKDRPYRQEVVDSMKTVIKQTQTFFAQQMAAHGYGEMTFRFETDLSAGHAGADGEPLAHRVDGEHGDGYYLNSTSARVMGEIDRLYESDKVVNLVVVDNSTGYIHLENGGEWQDWHPGVRVAVKRWLPADSISPLSPMNWPMLSGWDGTISAITPTFCRMAEHTGAGCRPARRDFCR